MALQPIKWRSKIILAKIEPPASYGVDAAPTGAANAMLLTDVQLQPMEGQDVSRNVETPKLGAQEEIPVGIHVVLTGSFELVGSGETGVAPAWGPLIRMCGVAEVLTPDAVPDDNSGTVEYLPVTDDHEHGSIHFHIGPSRHVITGARGNVELTLNAQGIPVGRVTITGLFTRPADAARPTVDLTKFQRPDVVTHANTPEFTIGGQPFVMRDFGMNLGNDVQARMLVGSESVIIVDRTEAISTTVEAVPLATYNPFNKSLDGDRVEITLKHGKVVGRKFEFSAPSCAQKRLTGYQENQKILEWPLQFTPMPVAGDDQWKITLS